MTKRTKTTMREFLRSGHLGPLSPEATLLETAEILGPPDSWMTEHVKEYPLFWIYGPKGRKFAAPRLEILFQNDAPHAVEWFQLVFLGDFKKRSRRFGYPIRIAAGGFSGEMSPSKFLGKGYWNPDSTTLYFSTHDLELIATCGNMRMLFIIWTSISDRYDAEQRETILRDFGESRDFSEIDQLYQIYSVTSCAPGTEQYPGPYHDMKNCTGRQYLDSMQSD